jgi:redox-sensitive bicupin YhaK (pirin superfamily)
MLAVLDPATHLRRGHGPFRLQRIHPGAHLGDPGDAGFGGLGLIDHATLLPGLLVPMHEHRDDEIVSYLREGRLHHRDSTGAGEEVRADRLMVMNAGAGFRHEERVLGAEEAQMLQIFIRPERPGLAPRVQFHDLPATRSIGAWRLLAGPPGGGAPAVVRQRLWLLDAFLPAGSRMAPPVVPPGIDAFLYVFRGDVAAGGIALPAFHGLTATGGTAPPAVEARRDSDLVLFLVDRAAPATRAGTLSGQT